MIQDIAFQKLEVVKSCAVLSKQKSISEYLSAQYAVFSPVTAVGDC